MSESRIAEYQSLVQRRKACRCCEPGLINPAKCESGVFDSDEIGPWSRWHGSLNAKLMVVGQDWGDKTYFISKEGYDAKENRTNAVLLQLIDSIQQDLGNVFLTNAILCLKEGGMQAQVDPQWFSNCGQSFLKPTIEIINPRVLVTLGERAYRSVEKLYGLERRRFRSAIECQDGIAISQSTTLFPMYHCSARILNTHRRIEQQRQDWARIRSTLC